MPKQANKIYVARDAVAMLCGLHTADYDKVMSAYHELFPDDYFDLVRPTDTAVWNAVLLNEGLVAIPKTSTYWRAWYAAYKLVNAHTRFCFIPIPLPPMVDDNEILDYDEIEESDIDAIAAE